MPRTDTRAVKEGRRKQAREAFWKATRENGGVPPKGVERVMMDASKLCRNTCLQIKKAELRTLEAEGQRAREAYPAPSATPAPGAEPAKPAAEPYDYAAAAPPAAPEPVVQQPREVQPPGAGATASEPAAPPVQPAVQSPEVQPRQQEGKPASATTRPQAREFTLVV